MDAKYLLKILPPVLERKLDCAKRTKSLGVLFLRWARLVCIVSSGRAKAGFEGL